MAQSRKSRPALQRPGSAIGRKGPRKAHPRYTGNKNKDLTARDVAKDGGNAPSQQHLADVSGVAVTEARKRRTIGPHEKRRFENTSR